MMSDVKPTKQTKENFNQFYEYDSENKTFKDVYVQKPDNGVDPASKSNSLMTKSETVPVKLEELDEYSTEAHIRDMKPALRPFAYTLAYFVNESNVLQKFIEMGVEIQQWDADREICEFVLKLNFERDVAPYLIFLHDLGLNIENTAFIIRKNPFFLRETLEDLEMRIKFYESKNFSRENVATILTKSPKWLTMPIEEMEKNLNWYLKEFQLNEQELRDIMIEQPKLCIIGTKCAFDMKFCFKEVLGYSDDRIKRMIKICPKLFTKEQDKIKNNYYYLADVVKASESSIAECPEILFMPFVTLRSRFSFLKYLKRDQFDPTKPNFVSLRDISEKKVDDAMFCKKVAKSSLEEFTKFLKSV